MICVQRKFFKFLEFISLSTSLSPHIDASNIYVKFGLLLNIHQQIRQYFGGSAPTLKWNSIDAFQSMGENSVFGYGKESIDPK